MSYKNKKDAEEIQKEINKLVREFKMDGEFPSDSYEKFKKYKHFGWNLFEKKIGKNLSDNERMRLAENYFLELIKEGEKNVYLHLELFYFYSKLQDKDSAKKWLDKALEVDPDEIECLKAKCSFKKTNEDPGIFSYINSCIEKYPQDSIFYRELGVTYRDMGSEFSEKDYLDKAIYFLEKAKEKANQNDINLINNDLGLVYDRKKDYREALRYFDKTIKAIKSINKPDDENLIKQKAWVCNAYFSAAQKLNNINEENEKGIETLYKEALEDSMKIYENLDRYTKDSDHLDKQNIGYIGLWYSRMNENELAIKYLTKAIELDGVNPWNHINLAYIYYNPQKNTNIDLEKIKKCWEILKKGLSECFVFQILIDMVVIAERMNKEGLDTDYKSELLMELSNGYPKIVEDPEEHQIVRKIFNITKEISNKEKNRYSLILLYKYIMELKNSLKAKKADTKGGVAHYTSINSLLNIIRTDESKKSRFRLYNIAYMNDPQEGTILLDALEKLNIKNIYEHYYPKENIYKGNKEYTYNNTFIGSFTFNKDELSLWRSYGEDCKGCSLVFDSKFFDYSEENVQSNQTKEKYCLYKVQYIENNGIDNNKIEDIAYALKEINEELNKDILNENEIVVKFKNEIKELVVILLDQVRFLFKHKHHSFEKEIRLVKFVDESKVKVDTTFRKSNSSNAYPRLYIEIDNELDFSDIILGSKVIDGMHLIPYLIFSKISKDITPSCIKIS